MSLRLPLGERLCTTSASLPCSPRGQRPPQPRGRAQRPTQGRSRGGSTSGANKRLRRPQRAAQPAPAPQDTSPPPHAPDGGAAPSGATRHGGKGETDEDPPRRTGKRSEGRRPGAGGDATWRAPAQPRAEGGDGTPARAQTRATEENKARKGAGLGRRRKNRAGDATEHEAAPGRRPQTDPPRRTPHHSTGGANPGEREEGRTEGNRGGQRPGQKRQPPPRAKRTPGAGKEPDIDGATQRRDWGEQRNYAGRAGTNYDARAAARAAQDGEKSPERCDHHTNNLRRVNNHASDRRRDLASPRQSTSHHEEVYTCRASTSRL